jgi:hypothetical protein
MAVKKITFALDGGYSYDYEIDFVDIGSSRGIFVKCDIYLNVPSNNGIEIQAVKPTNIYLNDLNVINQAINHSFYNYGIFANNGNAQYMSLAKGRYLVATTEDYTTMATTLTQPFLTKTQLTNYKFYDGVELEVWGIKVRYREYGETSSTTINYPSSSGTEMIDFSQSSYIQGIASTISASTTYIGENTVILVDRKDNTFTHTITYKFGSLSGTIVTKSTSTQIQWMVPGTFISQLGSADTKGTVVLTCVTYNSSGKQIGEAKTANLTVLIDASIGGPTFNPVVNDTNSITLALTGNSKILVKYFSNASVTSGAAGRNGATIKSQYIKNGNKIVNSGTATFNNIDTPVFEFSATDSRQFTANSSYTASYVDYSKLSSNIFVTTPTVAGNVSVRIEGNYFNGTFGAVKNTLTLKYRRKTGEGDYGDWITCTPTISGSNYYIEFQLTGLDYKQTHTFQTQAVDKLMTVSSAEVTVIGKPIFDWGKEDFHISVPLHLDEELHMGNGQHITAINQNGDVINALTPCDSAGNTVLGYGNYDAETGETYIYGNKVNIIANNGVTVNGTSIAGGGAENKILWQGTSTMSASDSISLSENITKQLTGIVLVFSASNADVSVNTFFLSKKEVELMAGAPHCFFLLNNSGLATVGAKYLYINNGSITGHDTNSSTGTAASGIKFTNNNFVLRYVIGV